MNWVDLLQALADFIGEKTADLIMPIRVQAKDEEQKYRAADVYKMRLPDSKEAKKKAPYVLIQLITAADEQPERGQDDSYAVVRIICCTYNPDEQEGALQLLNLASRIRINLLKRCVVGPHNEFWLDKTEKLEFMAYPEDTAPYYAGEMIGTWHMPPVQREVPQIW